jgi:hypothetical protein
MIILGACLRYSKFISKTAIGDFKKIIVNIALPSTLFLTFAGTTFAGKYLWIVLCVFSICVMMLFAGMFIGRKMSPENKYFPALFTGFEAGMLGYALFASFFGSENVFKFAIIDIGQVIFVFFVLFAFLRSRNGEKATAKVLFLGFFRSPVIISILLGVLIGVTGLFAAISENKIGLSFLETFKMIGGLTQPMICIVIGYELQINFKNMLKPLVAVLIRMGIFLCIAFIVNTLLIEGLLHLDRSFQIAVYTMFLLPPPFVIPIFMADSAEKEKPIILDTISLHILCSLAAYIVLVSIV